MDLPAETQADPPETAAGRNEQVIPGEVVKVRQRGEAEKSPSRCRQAGRQWVMQAQAGRWQVAESSRQVHGGWCTCGRWWQWQENILL